MRQVRAGLQFQESLVGRVYGRRARRELLGNNGRVELRQALLHFEGALGKSQVVPGQAINIASLMRIPVSQFVGERYDREVFDPGRVNVRETTGFRVY